MFEFAKKGFYVGLGLATMTKEKVEEYAKQVSKKVKQSEDEGHKFADYLQTESKKARETLKDNVDSLVQRAVKRLHCVSKIDELEKRIIALEAAAGIVPPETTEAPDAEETTESTEESTPKDTPEAE